jgi:NADPH-dependent 2,4-dienoyl-CoA reductase/sulfur reductase-like enzyme
MKPDVAIVGAGPAGMAAACELARAGAAVTVLDMQARCGGQVFRQPPEGFAVDQWLSQRVYRRLHALAAEFASTPGIDFRGHTEVLGILREGDAFRLVLRDETGVSELAARQVLVASGASDMPVAFPGSLLPGVMAAGGIQAFVKSQQFVPGERFVFAGSHPLQLIVANQVAAGGGEVAAVVFSQSRADFLRLLRQPTALLRQPDNLLYFAGQLLQALRRGIPLRFGQRVASAEGKDRLQAVHLVGSEADSGEAGERLACDRLGTCYGFLTQTELPRQAGADCAWSAARGGWVVRHDAAMQSSVPGLYVAGESTGIAGADAARLEGRLAGSAMARALDLASLREQRFEVGSWRRELAGVQAFAERLADFSYTPDRQLLQFMQPESVLCKCEEVTVGAVCDALAAQPGLEDLNGVKLHTRCGMGACQGRYCHYGLRALMAERLQRDPASLGGFTSRFPARPVSIGELIAP